MASAPLHESSDDRCPGALRLHAADDGHVARIRVVGGRLSAPQLTGLCGLADELGDGSLHLTSRGNLQVRGLTADAGEAVATRLQDLGLLPSLAHDRVRNVVAAPLGSDVDEILARLDAALVADPRLTALSARFLFAVGTLSPDPDLALLAEPGDGWRLWVAGEPTALTRPNDSAHTLMVDAARRFLVARDDTAPGAWRVSDLADAERGAVGGPPDPAGRPDRPTFEPMTLGIHDLGDTAAVCAAPPLGSAPTDAWRSVVELAAPSPLTHAIRLTPSRSVVVAGLPAHTADSARTSLLAWGFGVEDTSVWATTTACIGRPGCAKALADVRIDAPHLAAEHHGVRMHVSGCARRCGHPAEAHLEAVASAGGYLVREVP